MPALPIRGASLHYEDTGGDGTPIVFSHGLLMSCRMWDAQVEALRGRHRCIVYDHRGQGRSEVTAAGYGMDDVTLDAAELITALRAAPCHFVGLSMGGFVGMRLALRHPDLLRTLSLLETSADAEPPESHRRYRWMARIAGWIGTRPLVPRVMPILFGRTFMADPSRAAERDLWRGRLASVDRRGAVRATGGVIDRQAVHSELGRVAVPTLVVVGDEDTATVPAKAERIAAAIPGARLVTVRGAGHSSPVEQPQAVTEALRSMVEA